MSLHGPHVMQCKRCEGGEGALVSQQVSGHKSLEIIYILKDSWAYVSSMENTLFKAC